MASAVEAKVREIVCEQLGVSEDEVGARTDSRGTGEDGSRRLTPQGNTVRPGEQGSGSHDHAGLPDARRDDSHGAAVPAS